MQTTHEARYPQRTGRPHAGNKSVPKKGVVLRSSYQKHQELPSSSPTRSPFQLEVRIHWTAIMSFVFGLLEVALICFFILIGTTDLESSFWVHWLFKSFGDSIFLAMFIGGAIYALAGWIFGLIAFKLAQKPAWRKGLILAGCALCWDFILLAVALFLLLLFFPVIFWLMQ